MSQFINSEQDAKDFLPRYRILYALIAFTFTIFFIRLWYLQIINGNELRQFSEQNSIKETKIPAPRGIIYDRNGEILVENLPGFEATISPQYVTDLNATSIAVARALGMEAQAVYQAVVKSKRLNGPFRSVNIKDNLSRDEIFNLEVIKQDYSGIDIKENVLRSYPLKEDGAQLFGYVSEVSKKQLPILNDKYEGKLKFQQGDMIGKAGIEEMLDIYLRGKDGISVQQVDARGREALSTKLLGNLAGLTAATAGDNVILTIDKDLQEATYKAFTGQGHIGAAVAMKVNGEILSWVSGPSFDPNEFSTRISSELWAKLINDPDKPLRNKVIQDHNSPGSTFKPLVAISALCENKITANTVVSCPGMLKFAGRPYHDTVKGGHGNLVVTQAIEQSANIFFYKMGILLGIEDMFKYIDLMGIGHRTGIELPGERTGLMPNKIWKQQTIGEEWQPGENLSVAIGQGFVLTTPLQMAVAYNAIGNGGKIVKPFVIKRVLGPDNKVIKEYEPEVIRDVTDTSLPVHIRPDVLETVRQGLRLVVNGERGTARRSKLSFVEMAGKTGTSQVMSFSADNLFINCMDRPRHQRHHGWFIGYAPADHPEIAIGVLSEHACHGSNAAPVAKEIVRAYVAKYHPDWLAHEPKKKLRESTGPGPADERIENE